MHLALGDVLFKRIIAWLIALKMCINHSHCYAIISLICYSIWVCHKAPHFIIIFS